MASAATQQQSTSSANLRQTLYQFQIDDYLCDTELVADNGSMKVHAIVLAATSSIFKDALLPETKSKECVITVPGIEVYLLEIVVRFAYTGEIRVPKKDQTEDYLSTVISVLEQLGFKLSSITTSDETLIIADCSHGDLLPTEQSGESKSNEILKSDTQDITQLIEGPPDNSQVYELSFSSNRVGDDNSIASGTPRKIQSKSADDGKSVSKPRPPHRNKNEYLSKVGNELNDFTGKETNMDFKTEDGINVVQSNTAKPGERKLNDILKSETQVVTHHIESPSDNSEVSNLSVASPDHSSNESSMPSGSPKRPQSKPTAGKKSISKPRPPRRNKNVFFSPKHSKVGNKWKNCSSEKPNPVEDGAVEPSYSNLCDICGEVFDDMTKYRSHKMKFHRRRMKDLPVKCQQCGVQFANRTNLRRHMYQHTGERPHLCPHCGEGFIQRRTMQDHVISCHPDKVDRHSNFKSYQCRQCGEILHKTFMYRRHMKWHKSGEQDESTAPDSAKPYACETCGRLFAYKATLIIHSRRHADDWTIHKPSRRTYRSETGDSDNVCTACGKKFKYYKSLLTHERTHTGEKPFTCSECGRQMAQLAQLLEHMRIHTGEKPYKCDICGKQMRQRAHLTSHLRTHTGEKPYSCQLCDKTYRQIMDLRLHYRRVHQFELPKDPHRRPFNFDLQTA